MTLVAKRLKGKALGVKSSGTNGATVRAAGKRTLQISKLPSKGTKRVTITLRRGAVRLSSKVRKLARKGKRPKVRIKVRSRDTDGTKHTSRATAAARR